MGDISFIHEHPLIFIEDLNVDGETKAVCGVCEEQPSGFGYKCSECNFLCHKSCFELPNKIQHPLHPNHPLCIRVPHDSHYCAACGKCCRSCFFYCCIDCDFNLDTKCASHWRVSKDDCHQHAYVPLIKQIQFTCEACGEEGKNIGCLYCAICQLLIHTNCALFSRTITIFDHHHLLTLTYSIHQVEEHANILCKLCYKELNTKYAVYYCQECSFATHLKCARRREWTENMNEFIGSIDHITGLIKDINRAQNQRGQPQMIKRHFSHDQHDLILNCEDVNDDKLCDGCMQLISPPFYSCVECKFFLHNICAQLPTKARHLHAQLSFTLFSQAPFSDGMFKCYGCHQIRHGFSYYCERFDEVWDIQCFAIQETLQHESHQHPLYFAVISDKKCKNCARSGIWVCSPCNFVLCFKCATLPLVAKHKYDEHPFKLTYAAKDEFKEYYCLICEKERNPNHFFYYCAKCDFPAHPLCVLGKYPYIKFGKTYKDEHHQHSLTFARKTEQSPPCDVCNLHFNEVALECTQCKLIVHPRLVEPKKHCLQKLDKYGANYKVIHGNHMHP